MKNCEFKTFLLILVHNCLIADGFWIKSSSKRSNNKNVTWIDTLHIQISNQIAGSFPTEFSIKLRNLNNQKFVFEKLPNNDDYPIANDNIYTLGSGEEFNKVNSYTQEKFELYKEKNGNSFATLITNQEFLTNKTKHPFRLVKRLKKINLIYFN